MTPDDPETLPHRFAAALARTRYCLECLQPLLEEEQQALVAHDADRLQEVGRRKLDGLAALERAVCDSDALLRGFGYSGGLADAAALLQAYPDAGSLASEWQQLTSLGALIERLNAVNGRLTAQAQRRTRAALVVLTGREPSFDYYTRRGRDAPAPAPASLGKA